MSFDKKTIRDVNLSGKTVLLRADYNVTIKDGRVVDDYRIRESLETIQAIQHAGANKLVIISHLGRPDGKVTASFSLAPVANTLSKLIAKKVVFARDCIGQEAAEVIKNAPKGSILLLENLRFHAEEEKNDPAFAKALVDASGAQVFVQDAFGVSHRAHASTEAITKLLPAVAGLLLEKEITVIDQVIKEPKRPFTAVVGGAKIPDKIDVLNKFIEIADCLIVGGALANDFLRVKRIPVGVSKLDTESLNLARDILDKADRAERARVFNLLIPVDGVVSSSTDGKSKIRVVDFHGDYLASLNSYPKKPIEGDYTVSSKEMILDIGPVSAGIFSGAIKNSRTVVWSGAMGVTETKGFVGNPEPFAHGTKMLVEAMISKSNNHANKPFSVVGGGDTVGYIESEGLVADFNHVSTGGTASLELMAGHKLPAYEALQDK